jgi:hypothetical protein
MRGGAAGTVFSVGQKEELMAVFVVQVPVAAPRVYTAING